MEWTRHARNRLRWIHGAHPDVTITSVNQALGRPKELGYDDLGDARVKVEIGGLEMTVVVDRHTHTVITLWVR